MHQHDAPVIAVVGAGDAPPELVELAVEVGAEIARRGGIVVCGGRGGVMAGAARGATGCGGTAIGILPGLPDCEQPNADLSYRIFTGLGQARNQIIVSSAASVIAVGGEWGTLSEIGLALKHRVPVVLLSSFDVRLPGGGAEPLLLRASTAAEATELAFAHQRRLP